MTTADPVTGDRFTTGEMVDQVAIFFSCRARDLGLGAGVGALPAGALSRLAGQARRGGRGRVGCKAPNFALMSRLRLVTRRVPRGAEALSAGAHDGARDDLPRTFPRPRRAGGQPDRALALAPAPTTNGCGRTPGRASTPRAGRPRTAGSACARPSSPFSAGARVCTGAGFAMGRGAAAAVDAGARVRFETVAGRDPMPVAYLTVAREGRHLVEDIAAPTCDCGTPVIGCRCWRSLFGGCRRPHRARAGLGGRRDEYRCDHENLVPW